MTQLDIFKDNREMHKNSLRAFHEEQGNLSNRATAILAWFATQDKPRTDRDCMNLMGFSEPNCVRPRITELIGRTMLMEVGAVSDEVTGKTVRLCTITAYGRQQL